ncbi:MAG TPA: PLP-dependent aminotransferase family protein [Solirubrobacteraceae bacterium]|jgi:DNA-binding transcriptional MocR family regulator|nr:PLP-dependent aminotransferase family protein [Solirubrobacteraceae bacterium]
MPEIGLHRIVELLGDWRRGGPAAERLAATLRTLVLDGQMPSGMRLPAERALAGGLGLSRATVTAAYDRLRAEGYLLSTLGSGSWVTIPTVVRQALDDAPPAELDLTIASLPAPARILELAHVAIAKLPAWLDHHGYSPLGLAPLREAIAARYTSRGLPTTPDQVLVTAGALQAIDLTIRALLPRGRNALVELPSYPAVLDGLRRAGARLRSVPVSSQGWDHEQLEALCSRHEPALAYLIPDFHNPTGALMDHAARRRALTALTRAGGYVIVDETFGELNLDGVQQPPPFAAVAPGDRVITVGSLSKAVWGGMRVGWVRTAPGLIRRLAASRAGVDLSSPVLEQLIAAEAFAELDALLAERRELARSRRSVLAQALHRHLPDWRYTQPAGGLVFWVQMPQPIATSLMVLAREHRLALTPGPRFASGGLLERYVRLPFTARPAEIDAAVALIAEIAPRVAIEQPPETPLSAYAV